MCVIVYSFKLVNGEFKSKSKSVVESESESSAGVMCRTSESVSVVCDSSKECVEWLGSVSFK